MSERQRRLNALAKALGSTRYLEIGVRDGETFLSVDVENKVAVDPEFLFDWRVYVRNDDNRLKFHQCTSDEFFGQLSKNDHFDLFYIDGLHHYDQTFRDLLNSIRHASDQAVFLIDDTVPCDPYSCSRDMAETLALRKQEESPFQEEWHGDTYKIIPLLNLLLPRYNYATIIGSGNPQTLVWKKKEPGQPEQIESLISFLALENLAACDYLWMRRNLSLWHVMDEEQAIHAAVMETLSSL